MVKKKKDKPPKPYPEFPLGAANNGQWVKKVRGEHHYFGAWDDPDAALEDWLYKKDYLLAGIPVPDRDPGRISITVRKLTNLFLTRKEKLVQEGEESERNLSDYLEFSKILVDWQYVDIDIEHLKPDHFSRLRELLARSRKNPNRKVGKVRLANLMVYARAIFNWGRSSGRLKKPLQDLYGKEFDLPSGTVIKKESNEKPEKLFTEHQVRSFIELSSGVTKAAILLGINCGFGSSDIGRLKKDHFIVDPELGTFVAAPRGKTGKKRLAWLWPETIEALESCPNDSEYVLLAEDGRNLEPTKKNSNSSRVDIISARFTKVKKKAGVKMAGVGHYALRHTFHTIADELEMGITTQQTTGHKEGSMADIYRHGAARRNVKFVSEFVRAKIFGLKPPESEETKRIRELAEENRHLKDLIKSLHDKIDRLLEVR